jgi:ApbE superfamily uncharacterized protein (UPF0280 family)
VLPRGQLHLQHGPIDLVITAEGEPEAVERSYAAARMIFPEILPRLVEELPLLRSPIGEGRPQLEGAVAQRMAKACWPFRSLFITPMAAVAGSVADEVAKTMTEAAPLRRLIVNNGGDIAFHLDEGQSAIAGVIARVDQPSIAGTIRVSHEDPVRGMATSGWRGRSQSRGIADAVTVLARDAAAADAAATMIANAVNAEHPAVRRAPARSLSDDSDLGDMEVTTDVGALPSGIIAAALANGAAEAKSFLADGLIWGAVLMLAGHYRVVGGPARLQFKACH